MCPTVVTGGAQPREPSPRRIPGPRHDRKTNMTDNLPTVHSTHRAGHLAVLVWCKACHYQAPADLRAIIASGRGDVLVKDLRFRCAQCGSPLTDHVTMVKDALRVQPKFGRFVR